MTTHAHARDLLAIAYTYGHRSVTLSPPMLAALIAAAEHAHAVEVAGKALADAVQRETKRSQRLTEALADYSRKEQRGWEDE